MKQDIFTQVGKRTPYRTPEGFFEQQEQTLKQAIKPIVHRTSLHRTWFYAIAACAMLLIAVYPVMQLVRSSSDTLAPVSDTAPVYSQTSSVSDDWSDFAEADVFLDNMNW